MDDQFSCDLSSWLNNVTDRYVVTETLREATDEVTQVVYRTDAEGRPSVGPFIRKRFLGVDTRGAAYEQLLQAQAKGNHLLHQPIIYECDRSGDALDVVMEYVEGVTVRDLAQQGTTGVELAQRVIPDLCDAISELHESFEQPIIHRDIKPANIIVSSNRLALIDLGIARMFHQGATRDTVRYGTPGYAPPEQFGYGQTSVRSDVYALGMTLAFCLTGEDPSPKLREQRFMDSRIPVALRPVLCKATEFDPAQRYATAREFKCAFLNAREPTTIPLNNYVPQPSGMTQQPGATPPGEAQQPNTPSETLWQQIGNFLGLVWNVIVVLFWGLIMVALFNNVIEPIESLANTSILARAAIYATVFAIPFTTVAYLILDKRRLRKYEPFSRYTWKQEVPVLLGITILSIILGCVVVVVTLSGTNKG